jgi:hypothetical protein
LSTASLAARTWAAAASGQRRAAALQYVRKASGLRAPSAGDAAVFDQAVEEVAAVTGRLLDGLTARTATRTREGEQARARARGEAREARLRRPDD